jgi:hypothetical protein
MAVNTEHTRANVLQDCATWPAQAYLKQPLWASY